MILIEDQILFNSISIDKTRLEQQYEPLKKEMKQVEERLKLMTPPSTNLKDSEIEKVIGGLG